jgi:hypothetical protein
MFVIDPIFSLLSIGVVLFFYVILLRSRLQTPFGDMRSGLFVTLAEWAAKKVAELPAMQERAWKPNLLIPVEDPRSVRGAFLMIHDLAAPKGQVSLMGLATAEADERLGARVYALSNAFREQGVFASWASVEAPGGFRQGLVAGMQALRGSFFKPNVVFLDLPPTDEREADYQRILEEAEREEIGVVIHAPHPQSGVGERRTINVWIRDRTPDWSVSMDMGNLDLPILAGYKLLRNWDARMRLVTVVESRESVEEARQFLEAVVELGRIPRTRVMAVAEDFDDFLPQAPQADVSIFGLSGAVDFAFMRRMVADTRSTCLFTRDSGRESALA